MTNDPAISWELSVVSGWEAAGRCLPLLMFPIQELTDRCLVSALTPVDAVSLAVMAKGR